MLLILLVKVSKCVRELARKCKTKKISRKNLIINQKNPSHGRNWLYRRVRIIALCQNTKKKHLGLIWNASPFLRLYAGPIRNRTRGQSTSAIQNTSLFLRLHAGTIHESNSEHFLVFKAPCWDNPWVQSGTPPSFKAQRRDVLQVQSGTPPCF